MRISDCSSDVCSSYLIFLAVREESFYFYPVFACQLMNEGWASYWHARLLREADFLPAASYVDAIKCHSDVVRPTASGENRSEERRVGKECVGKCRPGWSP